MNNSYLASHMSSLGHSNKMNLEAARTKMYSPKMQLRDLMKTNVPQCQKENFNLNQSSVVHQRLSVENSLGEHPSNKTFESSKHLPPSGKMPESAKISKKSGRTNFANFLKNRCSKQNILEINTSFQPNITELLQLDSKPSSTKNSTHHSRYNYSPYQKRPSLFKDNSKINLDVLSRNFPQTVKNSHSIHYERFNSPTSTGVSSPKFTQAYHPIIYEFSNPTPTLHTQEDVAVKLISPAKLKAKEDRTRTSGVLSNLAKPDAKRGNSYRKNRRQSHLSETQDEPVSKLSTKAPSQYSDIRRSIPSQKSQSILKHETLETIEDCDNSSINQKSTYLFESKKKEKKALDNSRTKLSSQASLTKKPSIGFEQASPNFELSDNEKYESLRRIPISAIKKNSSTPKRHLSNKIVNEQGSTTINKSKEDYSLFSNHIEATNQKKKLKTNLSNTKKKITLTENSNSKYTRHHTEGFETNDRRMASVSSVDENYEYLFDRNCTYIDNDRSLEPMKLRETKTLSPPAQRLDKPPLSQKENMKQVLTGILKKDSANTNKRAKLKDIKNLIQDDEVLKDLQGLQLNNSSLKEKIRQQKQNLNRTTEDTQQKAGMQKDFYAIYFKTKKLIEEYQHREKQWANEKEILLARIEELEKNN